MNREQLEEIRTRAEKATPGAWYVVGPPWNSSGTPWVNAGSPDPHQMSFVCDLDADLAGVEREDGAGNEPADAEFIAHARTDVPALLDEIDRLNAHVAHLLKHGSPGVMHEADRAFYELAVKERDFERVRVDGLRRRLEIARTEATTAQQRLHAVRMVKLWTNEDGKRFAFADDILAATDPDLAALVAAEPTAEGSAEGGTSKGSEVTP